MVRLTIKHPYPWGESRVILTGLIYASRVIEQRLREKRRTGDDKD